MKYDWRVLAGVVAASALIGWLMVRQPAEPDLDVDEIERDLATLAAALRYDETVEAYVHPPGLEGLEFPRTMSYRRSVDFWASAFPSVSKVRR